MAAKKKLSQEEMLEKQKAFNAKLIESGAWTYSNGQLIPNPAVDYDYAKTVVKRITKDLC